MLIEIKIVLRTADAIKLASLIHVVAFYRIVTDMHAAETVYSISPTVAFCAT
jgi:hypothetical protein